MSIQIVWPAASILSHAYGLVHHYDCLQRTPCLVTHISGSYLPASIRYAQLVLAFFTTFPYLVVSRAHLTQIRLDVRQLQEHVGKLGVP